MTSYAELIARLKAADDGWESIGPQPATRVDEIESKFGVRLPHSFRQFLIEVGGIEYPSHYYTSIDDDYLDEQDGFLSNTNMLREQAGSQYVRPKCLVCGSRDFLAGWPRFTGKPPVVLQVQEVLSQLTFCDLIGRLLAEVDPLPDGPQKHPS